MPYADERVLSFADALAVVLEHAAGLRIAPMTRNVPLPQAAGAVLADAIVADRNQPPFDRSTRDGFALRAAELPGPLHIAGTLRAGEQPGGAPLAPGEALEIMTGAPVPQGADAVLMVEHAHVDAGRLWIAEGHRLNAGQNIVPCGSEAWAETELVSPGRRVAAPEIAIAASCGLRELTVFEPAKVAIIATGDELVELDAVPEAWQIRNSNGYALQALVTAEGGFGGRLAIAKDTRDNLLDRIAQGSMWDLMLLSGGVSMGKYDLVEEVLRDFGAEFFFTGTLIQPGKPLVFGRLPKSGTYRTGDRGTMIESHPEPWMGEWTYFFGLPGNPVSTEVCFHLFVAPFLRALAGQTERAPRFVEARLAENVRGGSRVTRFLPAVLQSDWQSTTVTLVPWHGSGDLAANARANSFAVLPAEASGFAAGETIRVLLR